MSLLTKVDWTQIPIDKQNVSQSSRRDDHHRSRDRHVVSPWSV